MKNKLRQDAATIVQRTPNNSMTISTHVPAHDLHTWRDHLLIQLKIVDEAIALETMQKDNVVRLNQQNDIERLKYERNCISLARIKAAHGLSIASAKTITGNNHTFTRDMAAKGRKLSNDRKKERIFKLYKANYNQARIVKMLGYSAPYVCKEIKAQRKKAQLSLRLLTAIN